MLNIFMYYTPPQFLSCKPAALSNLCVSTSREENSQNSVDPDPNGFIRSQMVTWEDPEGEGDREFDPPEKAQKFRISKQYWSGSPEKSQSYQASRQCWAVISPPAKHHYNGVSLPG